MYDNRGRSAAARQRRARVVEAARAAFLEHGYAGTTIRAVARAAEVSPETVYKAFVGKAGLLKAVYDVTLAGDDEDVPIGARPESAAIRAARTSRDAAVAYAALAGLLGGRTGPLLDIVLRVRGADPELEEFAAAIDAERLAGATAIVAHWAALGLLRESLTEADARDIVWTLNSPAVHALLRDRGWDRARYEEWLAATLLSTVLR